MHSINFTVTRKKFCLSLYYNGVNSYLFVNGTEIIELSKDSVIVGTPLCLGYISKDWAIDNMKEQDLMAMFMILVLIMKLWLLIFQTFISI